MNSSDQVVLNVGGRLFQTTISTLVNSSSYFASQFSDNWSRQGEEPIFIDQDSDAFSVLLSYMRCGFVKVEQLTDLVLFQAEFFGVESLIDEVKTIAYQAHVPGFNGTDEEAKRKFDEVFGSITRAVTKDILPALLRLDHQPSYDYAILYLHLTERRLDGNDWTVFPYYAGLCSKVFNKSISKLPTDAGGFMIPTFALNFMGKHGFRLAPQHLRSCPTPPLSTFASEDMLARSTLTRLHVQSLKNRGLQLGTWTFVRERQNKTERRLSIIRPSEMRSSSGPREYASLLVDGESLDTYIIAAGGQAVAFERMGGAVLRDVGVEKLKNTAAALEWLQSKGFIRREEELESIFPTKYVNREEYADADFLRPMIFSQLLREHEPMISAVIPLPFNLDKENSDLFTHEELRGLPYTA
jgi:hypothetical protein